MPASRYDELDADFATILDEVGIEVTWNGNAYLAIIADALINQTLATNNDTSAMLSEFLGNRTVEGRFWSV